MLKTIYTLLALVFIQSFSFTSEAATEFKKDSLIRDAEIEDALKSYIEPIFEVAGLSKKAANIYLIINDSPNAMATVDHTIFLQTGLITSNKDVGTILGVLAHETGHIAGHHIIRGMQEAQNASLGALAGLALGAGIAILGGRADASTAVLAGSSTYLQQSMLSYSRTQESSADQAAKKYLEALGWSCKPLIAFLESLSQQELLSHERQDPYMRTHPLTKERIEILRTYAKKSPCTTKKPPSRFVNSYARIRTKIIAYTQRPSSVLQKYDLKGGSIEALYACAIAHTRLSDFKKSVPLVDRLLQKHPRDPYFWQFRGDIFFESGNLSEAARSYEKASRLSKNPLMKVDLAKALLESSAQSNITKAIDLLTHAIHKDGKNAFAWHLMAVARGKQKQMALMALALAEQNLIIGNPIQVLNQVQRSRSFINKSPSKSKIADERVKIRLRDIEIEAQKLIQKN